MLRASVGWKICACFVLGYTHRPDNTQMLSSIEEGRVRWHAHAACFTILYSCVRLHKVAEDARSILNIHIGQSRAHVNAVEQLFTAVCIENCIADRTIVPKPYQHYLLHHRVFYVNEYTPPSFLRRYDNSEKTQFSIHN